MYFLLVSVLVTDKDNLDTMTRQNIKGGFELAQTDKILTELFASFLFCLL